jgi:CHASE3 domain sensor protein
MVELLRSNSTDAAKEVHNTKGVHDRHTYLKDHFKTLLERIAQYTAEQNGDEVKRHQNFAVGTYLLLVVGLTIFTDMSKNCVQLFYLLPRVLSGLTNGL